MAKGVEVVTEPVWTQQFGGGSRPPGKQQIAAVAWPCQPEPWNHFKALVLYVS